MLGALCGAAGGARRARCRSAHRSHSPAPGTALAGCGDIPRAPGASRGGGGAEGRAVGARPEQRPAGLPVNCPAPEAAASRGVELRGGEKRHLSPQGRFEKSSGKRREGSERPRPPPPPMRADPPPSPRCAPGVAGSAAAPGARTGAPGAPGCPLPPLGPAVALPSPLVPLPPSICRPRSSRRIPEGSRAGCSAARGMGEPGGLRWALPRSDPLTSVPRDSGYSAEAAAAPVTGETAPGSAARRCGHWLPGAVSHRARPAGWRSGSRTEKGERQYPAPEDYSSRRALRAARSLLPWGAGRAGHDGARSSPVSASRLASPCAPAGRAARRRGLAAAVPSGLERDRERDRDRAGSGARSPASARAGTDSPRHRAQVGQGGASDRCAAPLKAGSEARQSAQGEGARGREQRGSAFSPG